MGGREGGGGGFSVGTFPGDHFPGAFFLEPFPIKPFKVNVAIILSQSNFLRRPPAAPLFKHRLRQRYITVNFT